MPWGTPFLIADYSSNRLPFFGRHCHGSGQCVGDEKVQANAFFFSSLHQSLVKRLGKTYSELTAEALVVITSFSASRSSSSCWSFSFYFCSSCGFSSCCFSFRSYLASSRLFSCGFASCRFFGGGLTLSSCFCFSSCRLSCCYHVSLLVPWDICPGSNLNLI